MSEEDSDKVSEKEPENYSTNEPVETNDNSSQRANAPCFNLLPGELIHKR